MTWETEDMSDVQSQSQMTTDTYGYGDGDGPDQKVIWSDDPEQAYFRAMMLDEEDRSMLGDSTIHELLEGRQRFMSQDEDSMLQSQVSRQQVAATSGLSYYDTDAEDDTVAKIEPDVEDHGWFAARRTTLEGPPQARQSLETPTSASSPGASVAYKFNSPVSVLSSRDRAGEGPGVAQPFAVPNPNLVPRTTPAVGEEIVTDPQGQGHQRKIIPGYIFVTEGHSSVVETKKSSHTTKVAPNDKTPKTKPKSQLSNTGSNNPGQSPTKPKRDDLTVDTGDLSERRRRRKLCLCKLGIVFLMSALAVGIAMLALVFRSRRDTDETSQSNVVPPGDSSPTIPPNFNFSSPTGNAPIMVPTSPPRVGENTTAPTLQPSSNGNSDSEATPAPTTTSNNDDTTTVEDTVKDFLVSASPISAASLEDTTSPQYQALQWITQGLTGRSTSRLRGRYLQELDARLIQRWALAVLYFSTGGGIDGNATSSSWTSDSGWLESTNECEWSFVVCNDSGSLTELTIDDNALFGDIPPEIGLLGESLRKLSFNVNGLGGTLPTTLGLLTGLNRLNLQNNLLTGPIPTELGALSSLQSLILSRNSFVGPIPTQVGNLVNLTYLDLALTKLTGTIPTEVGQMMELEMIALSSTQISGTIPFQLDDLPSLKAVKFGRMNLVGEIPMGLCNRTIPLEEIRTDCEEVACPCCTLCCVDMGECLPRLSMATPTLPMPTLPIPIPTLSPTRFPIATTATTATTTSSPTKLATSAPTVMAPAPITSSPTATPPAPTTPSPTVTVPAPTTASPTDTATTNPTATTSDSCQSSLSLNGSCFQNGDDILVTFTNCDALSDDWIGVYPADQDFTSLQQPIAWVWLTGDQNQQEAVEIGTITFFDVQGSGNFKLALIRNNNGPPFSAHAVSTEFRLAQQCS